MYACIYSSSERFYEYISLYYVFLKITNSGHIITDWTAQSRSVVC
jgi:hypothetical protein